MSPLSPRPASLTHAPTWSSWALAFIPTPLVEGQLPTSCGYLRPSISLPSLVLFLPASSFTKLALQGAQPSIPPHLHAPFLSTEPTTGPHTTVSCALRPPHLLRPCSLQPRPWLQKCLLFTLTEGLPWWMKRNDLVVLIYISLTEGLPARSGLSDASGRIFRRSPRSSATPSRFSGRTADCPIRLFHWTAGLSRVASGSVPHQPWCPSRLAHGRHLIPGC